MSLHRLHPRWAGPGPQTIARANPVVSAGRSLPAGHGGLTVSSGWSRPKTASGGLSSLAERGATCGKVAVKRRQRGRRL